MAVNRIYLILCILICSLFHAQAQELDSTSLERKKVGLVLSGGASHGLAHIGVLKYLEEIDFPVDYITGTSMGSIIGALKSMGYTGTEIEAMAKQINWDRVMNNKVYLNEISMNEKYLHNKFPVGLHLTKKGLKLPASVVNSNNLDNLLTQLYLPAYKTKNFDDLPIPFKCFATDIVTGEIMEFNQGSLKEALRSSMSIPSMFSPVLDDDRLLVDGGVNHNFPASDVQLMGADIIIGAYVGARLQKADELNSIFHILRQTGFLMSILDFQREQEVVDILVRPKGVKQFSSFNFDPLEFFIEEGYQAAKSQANQFISLRDSLGLNRNLAPIKKLHPIRNIIINQIEIPNVDRTYEKTIRKKFEPFINKLIPLDEIIEVINELNASKCFHNIRYHFEHLDNNQNKLVVEAIPIRSSILKASLNRYRSTGTSILVGGFFNNYFLPRNNLRVVARISDYPGLQLTNTQRGILGNFNAILGLSAKLDYLSNPFYKNGKRIADYNLLEMEVNPYFQYDIRSNFAFKLGGRFCYFKLANRIKDVTNIETNLLKMLTGDVEIKYHSLNNTSMPKRGNSSFLRVSFGQVDLNYQETKTKENDFIQLELGIKQIIPYSRRWRSVIQIQTGISNYQIIGNTMHFGGTSQDRRNRLVLMGQFESGFQSDAYIYGMMSLSYDILPKFSLGLVYTPLLSLDDDFDGVGLEFKFNTPVGPVEFNLGTSIKKFNLVPNISLGHRFIF